MFSFVRNKLGLVLGLFLILFPFFTQTVKADEAYYKTYNVNVDIASDSTFIVSEDITVFFSGTYRKVFRGLTLRDNETEALCANSNSIQCGGFEYVEFLGFYDETGDRVPDDQYTIENVYESGEERLKVTWNFAPDGRVFNSEDFKYTIKYKVYGGLGLFNDYDLFYWDMLPPERPTSILESTFTINFPEGTVITPEDLRVLSNTAFTFIDHDVVSATNPVKVNARNIAVSQDITLALKFPKGTITPPGSLKLDTHPSTLNLTINGVSIEGVSGSIGGIPAGPVELNLSAAGYLDQKMQFQLNTAEEKLIQVSLEQDPVQKILMIALILCSICSCLVLPASIFFIYLNWYRVGRDPKYRSTIVPIYDAPQGIKPYLLGSLKDEKVDMVDITATMIDLARRGYLKIREFETGKILGFGGEKDYELIKQKEFGDLERNEKRIIEAIFDYKERVVVSSDLKYKFYTKVPGINSSIDEEMVEKGYFKKSPASVRNAYIGIGSGLLILTITVLPILGAFLLVVPPVFILLIDAFFISIVLLIAAPHMPAKTLEGAKMLNQILGFRMYLNTAERFRVQDLTPETFEKFLPYAMVFNIEKQWAERFKDIYKVNPNWYESGSLDTFNTIYMINSLSNFSTVTAQALTYSPSSSSGSSGRGFSGGGWSGGGGFGGSFGGGGGGGGSSGWG